MRGRLNRNLIDGASMDSFEFNKYAGSILGTLLLVMGLGFVSRAIYSNPAPPIGKQGYALPTGAPKVVAKAAAVEVPLPVLLSKADPKRGAADAKVCEACHNIAKGAGVKIGPNLWDVVGRAKGSFPGFDYSDGLKKKGGNWTLADINTFITNPKAYIDGTKMTYPGQPDAAKRADILAFLNTQNDHPAPLPAVTAAPAPAPAAAKPAAPAATPAAAPAAAKSAAPAAAPAAPAAAAPAAPAATPAAPAAAPTATPAAPTPAKPAAPASAPAAPAPAATPAPAAAPK